MIVNRKLFCEILDAIKFGLSKSKSLESMLYFQFTGKYLIAYNNQILAKHKFESDFTGFVHANNLIRTMNKITDKEVSIAVENENFIIKSSKVKLKLALLNDEEIKERTDIIIAEVKKCEWIKVPENFLECLKLCHFAISKNESQNTLQYAYINKDQMFASDNNRIALTPLSKKMKTMLIKHDVISVLSDLDVKQYGITKSHLHFKNDDDKFTLSIRRVVGKYPDFSEILEDAKKGTEITLSSGISDNLEISEIFSTEFDSSVTIKIKKGACFISANSDAGKMNTKTKIDYKGEDLEFHINPTFLNEMLSYSSTIIHGEGKVSLQSKNLLLITALMEKD